MSIEPHLGVLVRDRRKARCMSQEELARLIGCSLGAISKLERGVRRNPRGEIANGLIEHLGLTAEQVLGARKIRKA